jgi:hypothetical protein
MYGLPPRISLVTYNLWLNERWPVQAVYELPPGLRPC